MADYYVQGTVNPFLPLTPVQVAVIDVLSIRMRYDVGPIHIYKTTASGAIAEPMEILDLEDVEDGIYVDALKHLTPKEIEEAVVMSNRVSDGLEGWVDGVLEYEKAGGDEYYLYSEESGLGEVMTEFLREVLQGLPEDEYPYITWQAAFTCSKMRPDSFGGGAAVITRDCAEWMSTDRWVSEASNRLFKPSDADDQVILDMARCIGMTFWGTEDGKWFVGEEDGPKIIGLFNTPDKAKAMLIDVIRDAVILSSNAMSKKYPRLPGAESEYSSPAGEK